MSKDKIKLGYEQERVVEILENHLNSDGKVQRDVRLPVIQKGISGERQVDVLITHGIPPRETRSLVEVQKRNRKVGPDQFNAWLTKLREVGAQHLLCVSEAGFTRTVIERSREIGPTVRLLSLRQLEDSNSTIPDNFDRSVMVVNELKEVELIFTAFDGSIFLNYMHFSPGSKYIVNRDGKRLSDSQFIELLLFLWHPEALNRMVDKDRFRIIFGDFSQENCFNVEINDQIVEIRRIEFRCIPDVEECFLDVATSSYEQLDYGTLLWVRHRAANSKDRSKIEVFEIYREKSPGNYEMVNVALSSDFVHTYLHSDRVTQKISLKNT